MLFPFFFKCSSEPKFNNKQLLKSMYSHVLMRVRFCFGNCFSSVSFSNRVIFQEQEKGNVDFFKYNMQNTSPLRTLYSIGLYCLSQFNSTILCLNLFGGLKYFTLRHLAVIFNGIKYIHPYLIIIRCVYFFYHEKKI